MSRTAWDIEMQYDALSEEYRMRLSEALRSTLESVYKNLYATYGVFDTGAPAPLLRVDDKLQLSTRTEYIKTRSGTLQGISLEVYGRVQQERSGSKGTWAQPARMLRRENVPYTTSKAEQARMLRAMCDIVAVQEGSDYRLLRPIKTLPAHKEHLRPKKGKYG